MGLRVRLKASVDISGFPRQARVVLQALKRYGMILADNGVVLVDVRQPLGRVAGDALRGDLLDHVR